MRLVPGTSLWRTTHHSSTSQCVTHYACGYEQHCVCYEGHRVCHLKRKVLTYTSARLFN
jgi:hypothetical protein